MCWNVGTSGGPICVSPPVVLAPKLTAIIDADRQSHASMETSILPNIHELVLGAPHGELATKQLALKHVSLREILRRRYRVPDLQPIIRHHVTLPVSRRT
jgi:hypothetical protein